MNFSQPKSAEVLTNEAGWFNNEGLFAEALERLNRALALDPNYAPAYFNRGVTQFHLKVYHQALADLSRAIHLGHRQGLDLRVVCYLRLGSYHQALSEIESLIQERNRSSMRPPRLDYYLDRGLAYAGLGDHQKALDDFNRAVKLYYQKGRSDFALALFYYRGSTYFALKQYHQALADYDQALSCYEDLIKGGREAFAIHIREAPENDIDLELLRRRREEADKLK